MKKRYFLVTAFSFITLLLIQTNAFAGAWTVPKYNLWMELYMKYAYGKDRFDKHWHRERLGYDRANEVNKNARSWWYDMEYKLEYGITNWLNFLYAVSYEASWWKEYGRPIAWGTYSDEKYGIKYQYFGGKLRLLEDPVVFSLQLKYYLPGTARTIIHESGAGGTRTRGITLDRGDYKFDLRALVGKTFKLFHVPCYYGAETGYRWRSDESADDIPIFLEAGFAPIKWIIIKGELDSFFSISGTGQEREDYIIGRGGIVIIPHGAFSEFRKEPSFNISVLAGGVLWGENTTAAWEITTKVSTQFDIPYVLDSVKDFLGGRK